MNTVVNQLADLFIAGFFLNPGQRLFWVYLIAAALLALVYLKYHSALQLGTLRAYWLSDSALLDYRYFAVNTLLKFILIAPLLISAKSVALTTYELLAPLDSFSLPRLSYESITVLYTITLFVFSDFTRYWLHRWLHTSDALWCFHQVHHSPTILNPITFYRVHPVENFLFGLRYALSAGIVTGLFIKFFGARLDLVTILGTNIFIVIFSLAGSNLRHSAIRLSYGRWFEYFFISPAQHQIHHSARHMRYNYGGYLAIWDLMFGTLKRNHDVPEDKLSLGLGKFDTGEYQTLSGLFFSPFKHLFTRKSSHECFNEETAPGAATHQHQRIRQRYHAD